MGDFETTKTNSKSKPKPEQRFRARAVSRGIVIGRIVSLHGKRRQFYQVKLKETQIEREVRRFHAAVRLAKRQLKKLSSDKSKNKGASQATIFDTHQLILEDASLLTKIEETIREQKVNAEWAVKFVTDRYISIYKDIQDEHLRERHIDLQDIAERILIALGGGERTPLKLDKDSIIVAGEVKPSTIVELSESNLCGIVTESGGWTSHTFILARELRIPAVTGIKSILRRVKTGDTIIVDGYNGQVFINPTAETIKKYRAEADNFRQIKVEAKEFSKDKIQTLDGKKITLRANLDIGKGYAQAKRYGAQGIGLFRSEFLFNQYQGLPTEKQQYDAYRKIAELSGSDGVKIRTFDLSLEQLFEDSDHKEKNPALGLRAVRLCFSHEKVFRTQIRSLLRASHETNLDILLPMISDISEIHEVKKTIEREKELLAKRKIKFGNPKIGAMIEVPSAIMMIDEIAREVDFMSIGTNDLVQYLLGVDRDNELVADWFRTLHPAVLKAIKKVVEASEKHNVPMLVCGEMAGSPVYAAILVGLGAKELSMNVVSMPRVRQVITNIAFEEAHEVVKLIEKCSTADEVEHVVRENLSTKWTHLFPADILPPIRQK